MDSLLVILAIGIDPIVQQSIIVRNRMVESKQEVTLPRSQYFVNFSNIDQLGYPPTTTTIGALYSGLFSTSAKSSGQFSDTMQFCPTGNCNFPVFQSLAVCSSCNSISYAVEKTCFTQYLWTGPERERVNACQFSVPNRSQTNQTLQAVPGMDGECLEDHTIAVRSDLPLVKAALYGEFMLSVTILKGSIKRDGSTPVSASQCTLYCRINAYEAM
jgi:hypothetical protein